MSSFFLKGKPKPERKRKFVPPKKGKSFAKSNDDKKATIPAKQIDDEEIDSDDEDQEIDQNGTLQTNIEFSDDEEQQTPQDKRLRLAKKYLEEIEKEEQSRAEDKQLHTTISQRLNDEYLDSVGKLRKKIADEYTGYTETNVKKLRHKLQKLPITCICMSLDNKFLFSGGKTSIIVKWNLIDMKVIGTIDCLLGKQPNVGNVSKKKKQRLHVLAMALTSDFKFMAVATMNQFIQIWCPTTLKPLHTFQGHRDTVTGVVFRRDTHQMFSTSRDRSVKVWSLDEMAYVESLFGHQAAVSDIDALSRERAITSGGSDCSIRIWKLAEESQLIYNGHKGSIENVRLINEENFLSSGDDGSLCVWSAMKKKPLCIKELAHGVAENGVANWISSIATLLNTDIIASGSCDGTIKLWKLGDHYRTITLLFDVCVSGFVNSLAFTNDGNQLIAAIGQEHRLGRWWRCKEATNCVLVVPLDRIKK